MPTDYRAAGATVSEALALLDENPDFDNARDEDPAWPGHLERQAVLALRAWRDKLHGLERTTESITTTDTH
ncbi:hypothetical protein [Streptacidiphilus jiangxiensis]|uniref:Uncharacterized protein n=1 Tax=Streptacidiphilus jiangxiensis TaxID=235985 RepID=A0A1H8BA29_STRJI|nr:hypothetical protein [Streptacidiphilus jiangxiensis]SEM79805.1 hypothetical protein SAMN05414137_16010 [Streptacidiphilus jiangxiensis]